MPTLATFIQHSFGSPSHSNQIIKKRKRKERNGIQIGKEEVKLVVKQCWQMTWY